MFQTSQMSLDSRQTINELKTVKNSSIYYKTCKNNSTSKIITNKLTPKRHTKECKDQKWNWIIRNVRRRNKKEKVYKVFFTFRWWLTWFVCASDGISELITRSTGRLFSWHWDLFYKACYTVYDFQIWSFFSSRFQQMTTKECLHLLSDSGIPYGPINDVKQVFEDPQVWIKKQCCLWFQWHHQPQCFARLCCL